MKRKVIVFIDWFSPAFKAGGPIKSVSNIIGKLSSKCDFTVVTSNKDADGTILNVPVNEEIAKDDYTIYYLDGKEDGRAFYDHLSKRINPDVIYYNSIFSYSYTIRPLFYFKRKTKAKQIVAPRGMLGVGALSIKPLKKRAFLSLMKPYLFKKVIWHTSTDQESLEVKNVFGERARTFVAQNISSAVEKRELKLGFKKENELKLVFVSRVSEKKNLIYLLKIVSSLQELSNLRLDIYGPIEDESYWKSCLKYIELDDRVTYKGVLSPNEINGTLNNYQFYVLPSFNENYGHSIVEAINIGVPVMISNQTPWKDLEADEVGFDLYLDNDNLWQEKMKHAYSMDHKTYQKWSFSCYNFANKTFVNKSIINKNIDLFLSN